MDKNRESLFRKEALDTYSHPDQTDQLIRQPGIRSWIGLAGILILLIVIVFWFFSGTLAVKVYGEGIIVQNSSDTVSILFVPIEDGKLVKPGMEVQISPVTLEQEEYASVSGIVTEVSSWPVSQNNMSEILHHDDLPAYFVKRIGPDPFVVYVTLNHDPNNPEEYDWSDTVNYPPKIEDGTPCSGKITIRSIKPETLIFPWMNSIVP